MADLTVDAAALAVKNCRKCNIDKALDEFDGDKSRKGGRHPYCKACRSRQRDSWKSRNRERHLASMRAWGRRNPDRKRAYALLYDLRHPGRRRESRKKWAEANRDRIVEAGRLRRERDLSLLPRKPKKTHAEELAERRQQYQQNREARLSDAAQYRRENLEKVRVSNRASYARNPEKRKASSKKWREANAPKRAAMEARRRAVKKSSGTSDKELIAAFYVRVQTAARLKCYWCGKSTKKEDREVDHIVPLSRRGPHAIHNLCCACTVCNNLKRAKLPEEFNGQHLLQFQNPT